MTNSEHNPGGPAGGTLDGSNVRHLDSATRYTIDVPGSKGYTYRTGMDPGLWVTGGGKEPETTKLLNWCPLVIAHLGGYNPRGKLVKRMVTLQIGQDTATVRLSDLDEPATWEQFPGAIGVAKRDVREVLANVVNHQAARIPLAPLHPRWVDGRLVLPPADALPRGYGIKSGTDEEWRALLREIGRSPRLVLASGLGVGGLYVLPLQRQSYTAHYPGASSEGKTTASIAGASFFGDPGQIVIPWSVTKQGPGSWLRSMVLMTGFRDEAGSANLNPAQWETLLFTLMQGAERDMSSKTGDYRESQGSWHGALISNGNESLVAQIANEGIAARVVEITGPFTLSAEHADRIADMAAQCHGHGLLALAERGPAPMKFRHMVTAALEQIGAPNGGVPRRVAEHLAMGVAGAQVIGELAGVPEFARAAVAAARGVLSETISGLAERGARPGDRLIDALRGSLASTPNAWPTRERYVKGLQGIDVIREVLGYDVAGDPAIRGDLAVIPSRLGGIAAEAGIKDPGIALQDLRKRELLTTSGKRLQAKLRVGEKSQWTYLIGGVVLDDDTPDHGGFEPPTVPAPRMAEGPCEKCLTPGQFCAPGGVGEHEEPCVLCGLPTLVRSLCGVPRTGHCAGPTLPPAPRRGAHPAAVARTAARQEAEAAGIGALETGKALRLLGELESTYLPWRRTEKGRQKPYLRPELPGVTYAAHVVTGWAWDRPYDGETVVLDRSGAWVAAAASVEVGHGALEHTGELEFEGKPGYYEIQRHPWTETDLPDPLNGIKADTLWVPAPTVALLRDLAAAGRWADVTVLDSYTAHGVRLRSWTDYVKRLREQAITKYGRDSEQYEHVKRSFGMAMSLMLGEPSTPRKWKCGLQRPDWTHAIQAQASATLWRWADDCLKLDCPPVAVRNVDELVIPADALETVTNTERVGGRKPLEIDPLGIKLGTFKVKAASNV